MTRLAPSFHVNLIGRIWQGQIAAYSYVDSEMPKDARAVLALAGEFQSVIDYQVVKVTRGGEWSHEWTRRKVVREWTEDDSQDAYFDMTDGGI